MPVIEECPIEPAVRREILGRLGAIESEEGVAVL